MMINSKIDKFFDKKSQKNSKNIKNRKLKVFLEFNYSKLSQIYE